MGTVTSDIWHGELFLHPEGEASKPIRLRWEPDAGGARALAPGTYVLTGYRQVATAEDGKQWIWSTASAGYRRITVKAGEATHAAVRRKLDVRTRAFVQKKTGQPRVGLVFVAEKKLGNTLYRDGKRIAIKWQLLGAKERVLAEGTMKYG